MQTPPSDSARVSEREPEDVLADERLGPRQKLSLLQKMRHDEIELQVATSENMPAPGRHAGKSGERLQRIEDALTRLEQDLEAAAR